MSKTTEQNRDDAPLSKKLEDLYDLIEGIEIAMFTTRRPDGRLVSRPMATQTQAEGSDLWFVTDIESNKLDELQFDPHVNLAYYKDRTREWVSVSGTATMSQERRAGGSAARARASGHRVGRLPQGQQASARGALRSRQGDGDGHAAEARGA